MKTWLYWIFAVCAVAGCGAESTSSNLAREASTVPETPSPCLRLSNAEKTPDFRATGLLARKITNGYATCTATFIAPRVMLTAAHCLDGTPNGGVHYVIGAQWNEPREFDRAFAIAPFAEAVLHLGIPSGKPDFDHLEDWPLDLALVRFGQVLTAETMTVASAPAAPGDEAILVGYGRTGLTKNDDSVLKARRFGHNVIAGASAFGLLRLDGRKESAPDGGPSLAFEGDSGGPLLVAGKIAGVFSLWSARASSDEAHSYYTDLASPPAKALLARAYREFIPKKRGPRRGSDAIEGPCATRERD